MKKQDNINVFTHEEFIKEYVNRNSHIEEEEDNLQDEVLGDYDYTKYNEEED